MQECLGFLPADRPLKPQEQFQGHASMSVPVASLSMRDDGILTSCLGKDRAGYSRNTRRTRSSQKVFSVFSGTITMGQVFSGISLQK
jgi:hypothetical protein